jgi:predicted RNA-binding protein YlxR (DUF448 family)
VTRGRRDRTLERLDGLDRRCIATGEGVARDGMIRFVLGPEGSVVPDLAEKLPGRGVWVSATRAAVQKAVEKRLFSRGLKTQVTAPDDLVKMIERLLTRRLIDSVAMARKAGAAVCGFERVRDTLATGHVTLLFGASDGAEGGKSKIRNLAEDAEVSSVLTSAELGLAFGRETVIHAALLKGGVTKRVLREAGRLEGFRSVTPPSDARGTVDRGTND